MRCVPDWPATIPEQEEPMGILDKVFGRDDDKDDNMKDSTKANMNAGSAGRTPMGDTPVADFSDVHSSSASAPVADIRSYTVKSGDSLSKIAQHEYGDAGMWKDIYEANRGIISNPDLIHPGQVLTIPDNG